jgi:hypothetical protein
MVKYRERVIVVVAVYGERTTGSRRRRDISREES